MGLFTYFVTPRTPRGGYAAYLHTVFPIPSSELPPYDTTQTRVIKPPTANRECKADALKFWKKVTLAHRELCTPMPKFSSGGGKRSEWSLICVIGFSIRLPHFDGLREMYFN